MRRLISAFCSSVRRAPYLPMSTWYWASASADRAEGLVCEPAIPGPAGSEAWTCAGSAVQAAPAAMMMANSRRESSARSRSPTVLSLISGFHLVLSFQDRVRQLPAESQQTDSGFIIVPQDKIDRKVQLAEEEWMLWRRQRSSPGAASPSGLS